MGFIKVEELPELRIADGVTGRAVTAQTVTVFHAKLAEGALLPEHSHHHEQILNVLEGTLELTVDGSTHILVPGNVMIIPPNAKHSGRVINACRVIDVFHPVREDFRGTSFGGYSE